MGWEWWLGLDEIGLDGRHRLGILSGLLLWDFGSDEIRPTVSFQWCSGFLLLDRFWVATVGVLDVGLHFACRGFFFFSS